MNRTGYKRRYYPVKCLPLVPFMAHKEWYSSMEEAKVRLNYLMNRLNSINLIKHEPGIVWCDVMTRGHLSAVNVLEAQILAVKKNIKQLKEQTNG